MTVTVLATLLLKAGIIEYICLSVFKYAARILPRPPPAATLAPAMYHTGTANRGHKMGLMRTLE